MIFRHTHLHGEWIDLEQPSDEEIRSIAREFAISERLETELLSPTPLPLVAGEASMALLVLHFPTHGAEDGETKNQEIDFIVGNHFILTVRYEVVAPLHHLRKLLEAETLLADHTPIGTDVLLEILFAHLYASVRDHTNHIASRLATVEKEMFTGRERHTIRKISSISREFLHIESVLANQEDSLSRFLTLLSERNFFGASFAERSGRILTEHKQAEHLIHTHRAVASELRETNIALLEARQNEIMKTLTVITFIMLPLELITLVFDMHLPGTPLEQNPNAFWIVIAMMLITFGILTSIFASKRWIF